MVIEIALIANCLGVRFARLTNEEVQCIDNLSEKLKSIVTKTNQLSHPSQLKYL
jgi:hypothetical protein